MVLEFTSQARLKYSLFFPQPNVEDTPENYFFMTYELAESDGATSLLIRQEDPRPSSNEESSSGEEAPDVRASLKELVEAKMP